MRSEPERWASMRSAASREESKRFATQAQQPMKRPHPDDQPRVHAAKKVMTTALIMLAAIVWFGIISAFDKRPMKAFLTLLVVMGGQFSSCS